MEQKYNLSPSIEELITAYADGEIKDADELNALKAKIDSDENLKKKLNSEFLLKKFLKEQIKEVEVPDNTVSRINSSIENLIGSIVSNQRTSQIQSESFIQRFKKFLSTPLTQSFKVPRYAFGIVLVLIFGTAAYIVYPSSNTLNPYILNGSENSIMVQAVNNFHKILEGKLNPQMTSASATDLKKYFASNANFDAYVPSVEEFNLDGGICSEYKGQKMAHVLYTSGKELIYIYQIPVHCMKTSGLELPDEVQTKMKTEKMYLCDEIDEKDNCLAMWIRDGVICASVSNMSKKKFTTKLISFNLDAR